MPPQSKFRLASIDWLRGLACLLMFQTHCYDAWLGAAARTSKFFMWSQILGTFPAPLFLFLAGISFAMVTHNLIEKGFSTRQIAAATIRRGAEIFALGILFRIQEFVIAWGWAPWSDLLRVDILNTIGLSMMLMGTLCWIVLSIGRDPAPGDVALHNHRSRRNHLITAAVLAAAVISFLTPLLWTTWRPSFLPWPIESYIDGVHNLNQSQSWLFPLFPWSAFAFAGLAFGFISTAAPLRRGGARPFLLAGAAGIAFIYAARFFDSLPWRIYPVYDFWHTSPDFFLIRVGFLLLFALAAYAWCRWGLGARAFSPLIQLGQTSLLVYWVHIELVYGRFHILPARSQSIAGASAGLAVIFVGMLALSLARTRWKGRAEELFSWRPGLSRSAGA
jgi:uncharacterized membrane protein